MAEPAPATCEAMEKSDLETVLAQFGGNAHAALTAALSEIAFLQHQLSLANAAMSVGFTRGWRPKIERDEATSPQ